MKLLLILIALACTACSTNVPTRYNGTEIESAPVKEFVIEGCVYLGSNSALWAHKGNCPNLIHRCHEVLPTK